MAIVAIVAGLAYSLYDFGGLTTITQFIELVLVVTFLIGTYQLAHEKPSGYLLYFIMVCFNGALMWIEHYPWLVAQQVVSLGFIVDAYLAQKRKSNTPRRDNPPTKGRKASSRVGFLLSDLF